MNIYDYFAGLQRGIFHNRIGFPAEPIIAKAVSEHFGIFRVRIIFWDGSHLTIDETVDTSRGFPDVIHYAYTYVQQNKHLFRYDNAPHYPDLDTFPHHKHTGPNETPQAAVQPTLSQVFREIEEILDK